MKITIIGGTGRVGRRVAHHLTSNGHIVVSASPSSGVDAVTGRELSTALEGAEVVVNLIEARTFEPDELRRSLGDASRNISKHADDAGVRHQVLLSVVGTPRLQASPYFQGKLAQKEAVAGGGLPFTIVRATQFFEFLGAIADMNDTAGIVTVKGMVSREIRSGCSTSKLDVAIIRELRRGACTTRPRAH